MDELPFDFQRRRMSVVVDYDGDHVLICKGAVEEIYDCCSHYQIGDEVYPLIEMIRDNLFEEVDSLNRDGFRVLAIAYREFPREKTTSHSGRIRTDAPGLYRLLRSTQGFGNRGAGAPAECRCPGQGAYRR